VSSGEAVSHIGYDYCQTGGVAGLPSFPASALAATLWLTNSSLLRILRI
jgi:hypothetical protein